MARVAIASILLAALLAAAPAASASEFGGFAPLDRKGPRLPISKEKLRASVECTDDVRDATRAPVLLLPATGVDSHSNFSWNYERVFRREGIPYCTSDQPGKRSTNLTDIQTRGYFLTYAVRHAYRLAGRKIAMAGHSQGGMVSRIPLRWWPDTRKKVDDVIGFAGTNHGTDMADATEEGTAAGQQQASNSQFIRALNSRAETFRGISYTEIFTNLDEVVTPPRQASSVSGPGRITNVATQDLCPLDPYEHLGVGTLDAVAEALTLDALNHDGPADPGRIAPSVCASPFMSGFDPVTGSDDLALAALQLVESQTAPGTPAEPALRCWVFKDIQACRRDRARS